MTLRSAGIGQPMRFKAELTNPKPPGLIHTSGRFGPWNLDVPSETPVGGHYEFEGADLSIFTGISGILASTGDYSGMLRSIVVDGTTDVPSSSWIADPSPCISPLNFTPSWTVRTEIPIYSRSMHNSSTRRWLRKVRSWDIPEERQDHLPRRRYSRRKGTGSSEHGSRLAQTDVDRVDRNSRQTTDPAGKQKVLDKIRLSGNFRIDKAWFTSDKVNDAIDGLSRRAQGKPGDQTIQDVTAVLMGTFSLANSQLSFSNLQFEVPGAAAQVKGSYGLVSDKLDFTGDVRLQAHVSNTMSGAKRVLLKPIDPIFARHKAGTYLPVNLTGDKDHPQIKLDVKKVF